ncbi:MAG: sulfite oxidase heme-binding subunit YedZ [Terriglobia bacterium]
MLRPRVDNLKLITHLAALAPLACIFFDVFADRLSAEPIRDLMRRTGRDGLVLLSLTLAIRPLSEILGLNFLKRLRRTIGLYAFFYVCLHFLTFTGLDYAFDWRLIKVALFQRPFAYVGFATFLILLPLALTSTNAWRRRLGRNWKRLHWLIYPAALLDSLHFLMQAKAKALWAEPLAYAATIIMLLVLRVPLIRRLTGQTSGENKHGAG